MHRPLKDLLDTALATGAVSSSLAPGERRREDFVSAVTAASPFFARLVRTDDQRLGRVLAASPEDGLSALFPSDDEIVSATEDPSRMKSLLRAAKADLALGIGLCDLSNLWDLEAVTACLTRFADQAVTGALTASLGFTAGRMGIDDPPPVDRCGLSVIAMGKHGARELNYSSDIDLVCFFDPDRVLAPSDRFDEKTFAVRCVQGMVDVLSSQTAEGYVFRTDLRLRPNPSATAVAVSLEAAAHYYEVYGQNWERAAFIKARPVAGDETVAEAFLSVITPFVWRRALDFAAVADIHAVKKQIHAQKDLEAVEVRGGNVKLGPGGIREIEFFAQTQQLLLGGRHPALRTPKTLEALTVLRDDGHISSEDCATLSDSYRFLRDLEHCLQMREDQQTQEIPVDDAALAAVTAMMGRGDPALFESECEGVFRAVHHIYADLFAVPDPDEPLPGSLVFTGVDDDPRTLQTLSKMGFSEPGTVTERIRRWHSGGLRATRSVRAREVLTALTPRLLSSLSQRPDPSAAFAALDGFLSSLPDGFQIFSLFSAQPEIMEDVMLLCQSSPELARRLGSRPALVESLIEGADVAPVPLPPPLPEETLEDRLDIVRLEINEHRIRSSAAVVLGRKDVDLVSQALSEMADRAVTDLVSAVMKDLEEQGAKSEGALAVLGFGRLGTCRLTPESDLDLVFVYQADADAEEPQHHFTRLIRRIVSALSVPTAQGPLYTIDMKLRPSGGAGPAAVTLDAFDQYYHETAWVWEEMALTKARVISGPDALRQRIERVIDEVLTRERDPEAVFAAVKDMRRRLLTEKPPRTPFDTKRLKGGLTDVDFIAQGLSLVHAHSLGRLPRDSAACFARLTEAGVLSSEDGDMLADAATVFERLTQYTRAAFGATPPAAIDSFRAARLRQICSQLEGDDLQDAVNGWAEKVAGAFERLIAPYADD